MDYSAERLTWCPNHHTEDNCALESAWESLKARHAANCDQTNCEVNETYKFIKHGNSAVHANVETFWRNRNFSQ